ncbi:hypothetical protein ACLOJK_037382 [Asimina triloba]
MGLQAMRKKKTKLPLQKRRGKLQAREDHCSSPSRRSLFVFAVTRYALVDRHLHQLLIVAGTKVLALCPLLSSPSLYPNLGLLFLDLSLTPLFLSPNLFQCFRNKRNGKRRDAVYPLKRRLGLGGDATSFLLFFANVMFNSPSKFGGPVAFLPFPREEEHHHLLFLCMGWRKSPSSRLIGRRRGKPSRSSMSKFWDALETRFTHPNQEEASSSPLRSKFEEATDDWIEA